MPATVKRVLLVEDDPLDYALARTTLARGLGDDVEIVGADRLAKALGLLAAERVDIVVLDLHLPDSTGLGALHCLRQVAPRIPVIILTSSQDDALALEAIRDGAADYVSKGTWHGGQLCRAVKLAVERARSFLTQRRGERRYAQAMLGPHGGVFEWNLVTGDVWYSPRCLELLGLPAQDPPTALEAWLDRVHPKDLPALRCGIAALEAGREPRLELAHRLCTGGGYRRILCRATILREPAGPTVRVVGSWTDLDRARRGEPSSEHDPWTRLPSRPTFLEQIRRALAGRNHGDRRLAVLAADLGSTSQGRSCIARRARMLDAAAVAELCLRPCDAVARSGDDTLAILLDPLERAEDALRIARRLSRALASTLAPAAEVLVGVAIATERHRTPEDLLEDAEEAARRAHPQREGGCRVAGARMQAECSAALALEEDLQRALATRALRLRYQPVLRLRDRRVTAWRTLPAWRHARLGLLDDAACLRSAEGARLLVALRCWWLREACWQAAAWQSAARDAAGVRVKVPLATREALCDSVLEQIEALLETAALAPASLTLELDTTLGVTAAGRALLTAARRIGVEVQLDLGAASALGVLAELPADAIGMGRDLVAGAAARGPGTSLARHVVRLAHERGLQVVATGLEVATELAMARDLGCDEAHGSAVAAPVEASEVRARLR